MLTAPEPTMRTIAAAAGVCPATVSLALRSHPSIPPGTQARIQRIARVQGYRPDPTIAKLMFHLATARSSRLKANLCAFTAESSAPRAEGYVSRLLRSLRARTEALGYSFSLFNIAEFPDNADRLRRILRNRGIEGILLTSMGEAHDLTDRLDWGAFSVVSTTPSVARPQFHGVSPNHYDNALLIFDELTKAGYRRIGLALPADRDLRVRHRWSGAMAWHIILGPGSPVVPLLDDRSKTGMDPGRLVAWLKEQRPDVVVTDLATHDVATTIERALPKRARPPVVAMHWPMPKAEAGIDQNVEEIGAAAVNMLAGLIQHGEKGVPRLAHTTMINGKWVRGTLKQARA